MSIDERPDTFTARPASPARPTASPASSPEELAAVAAEVVAMIEHHRDELRVAMDELTALQRTVRSEIRQAIHELDRIAAGLPATDGTSDPDDAAPNRRRGRFRR